MRITESLWVLNPGCTENDPAHEYWISQGTWLSDWQCAVKHCHDAGSKCLSNAAFSQWCAFTTAEEFWTGFSIWYIMLINHTLGIEEDYQLYFNGWLLRSYFFFLMESFMVPSPRGLLLWKLLEVKLLINIFIFMFLLNRKNKEKITQIESRVFQQDNAPAHHVVCQEFSSQVWDHNVRPFTLFTRFCTRWLLSKVKSVLNGTRFESFETVKENMACVQRKLTGEDFQPCSEQWKIHRKHCSDRGRVYIEGDNK